LGCDSEGGNQCLAQAHPDPFLRSMALWILKDYTGSLNTLLQTNTGSMHPQYSDSDDKFEGSSGKPQVKVFYHFVFHFSTLFEVALDICLLFGILLNRAVQEFCVE
jgi:hypothetical protein